MSMIRIFTLMTMSLLSTVANSNPPALPPSPVEIIQPKTMTRVNGVAATGELFSNRAIVIKSEIPGKIVSIHLPEGKSVEAGTLLVELDDAIPKASLQQATAKHENSLLRFNRMQALTEKGIGSKSDRDEALATLRCDEANVALAKAQHEKTKIRAPFSGMLGLREVDAGDYVDPGQPLINLDDIQTLMIDFSVPEKYFTKLKAGQSIEITVSSLPKQKFEGRIVAVSPQVNHLTHTIQARALLSNSSGQLRPGLFAKVRVVFSKNTQAIVLPEQAVFAQQGKQYVYVVKDGAVALRQITTGSRENGEIEILKGIASNDAIVKSGHMRLYDGAKVFEVKI